MLWSILIAGVPERYHTIQPLLFSLLERQGVAKLPDVEILYLMDNKRRPVGAKRNDLLAAARGEYVSFIDDDDEVASEYVGQIRAAIKATRFSAAPADVICFVQLATIQPQGVTHECHYSLAHWRDRKPEERRQLEQGLDAEGKVVPGVFRWTGPPAHTMIWRRELVAGIKFPETTFGEDVSWVDAACALAKHEVQIEGAPLYEYRFDESKSATR